MGKRDDDKYQGGIVIVHPGLIMGNYVVVETNIKNPLLVPGKAITSDDVAGFVQNGATILVQRKGATL